MSGSLLMSLSIAWSQLSRLGTGAATEHAHLTLVAVWSTLYLGRIHFVRFNRISILIACIWGNSIQLRKLFAFRIAFYTCLK